MKNNSTIIELTRHEGGCATPDMKDGQFIELEAVLRAIERALMCIGEGNTAGAAQLLYGILPKDRRPSR